MPSTTAQSLLDLPADVTDPSPYSVFGLRAGERDSAAIKEAIQATVARLNAAKPAADPAAWRQAAVWVKRSRGILLDPAQKTQLDSAPTRDAASAPSGAAAADPLAGLLPPLGQAAAAAPAPARFRPGPVPAPAPHNNRSENNRSGSAAEASPSPEEPGDLPLPLPIPVVKSGSTAARRRRRRFPWAAVVLGSLTLTCIGGIVGLVYFLNKNPGGIVVNVQGASGTPTGPAAAPRSPLTPQPAQPRREPVDPVMGSLGGAPRDDQPAPVPRRPRDPQQLAAADNWLAGLGQDGGDGMAAADSMPMPDAPASGMPPGPSQSLGESEPAGDPQPPAGDSAAAQAAIDTARQAIAEANWEQMQPLAEAAQQAAVTPEQKQQASGLFQLAELASYYHGGIEKGLDGLGAGESFDVTEQLKIVVVEIGPENVVFRFSGRNKEYPRREIPLVLAHRIADFSIAPDSPTATAAANAYQAVAPITTDQYRQQAIRELQEMTEQVEGAEPAEVADAIKDVFGL